MLLFDTGRRLEKAFTAEQFDALVEVLERREDKAATREDLRESELRTQLEIEKTRAALKADIERARSELQTEIERVRSELQTNIEKTRAELKTEIEKIRGDFKTEIERVRAELKTDIEKVRGKWRESNTICSNGRSPAGWLLLRLWRRGSTGLAFEPARALFRPLFQGAFCFFGIFLA